MRVKVKIVVFEHPAPQTFGKFCGYCPATKYFCSGTDVTDISNRITDILMIVLQQRKKFPNYLKKRGWKITENSIESIIRKSKFPQNPKRSVRFSGKRTKRSVQKRKARNTQKAETKVL